MGREGFRVVIFVQLITDIDLALALLQHEQSSSLRPSISCEVWLLDELRQKIPRVERLLGATPYRVISRKEIESGPDLKGISAILCPTETTAGPHKPSRLLTEHANKLGLPTYTLQHGFDNIGLTFFDKQYPPSQVRFASSVIFTWGPLEKLHPDVLLETRVKCVPVGVPKPATLPSRMKKPSHRVISIFENLHWDRYSDNFRAQFLADFESTASSHPDVTFIIKPHPAGVWLTQRYKGKLPSISNMVIAAPTAPEWSEATASDLLAISDGVITTPSTIAVDAARASLPTAVVSYDLDTTSYAPLEPLRSTTDWSTFVDRCVGPDSSGRERERSQQFVREHFIETDTLGEILSYIHGDCELVESKTSRSPIVVPAAKTRLQSLVSKAKLLLQRPRGTTSERIKVIISFYNARSPHNLIRLLDALAATPAGSQFSTKVVVNRAVDTDLVLPARHRHIPITYRENIGYNIGAWDAGWRDEPHDNYFLFLQDECQLVKTNWAQEFLNRFRHGSEGLLGEKLSERKKWDAPWSVIRERYAGHRLPDHWIGTPDNEVDRLECYFDFWRRYNIELGAKADHVHSLVLFTSREVLERIDGFNIGRSYGEAIASEIAISKKVQASGWKIGLVGKAPFTYFKHPQWSDRVAK